MTPSVSNTAATAGAFRLPLLAIPAPAGCASEFWGSCAGAWRGVGWASQTTRSTPREGPVDSNEREAFERDWAALSEEVLSGMADWRAQHPRATLSEIEAELDARLARMRARLLERVAQQSTATTWRQQAATGGEDAAPRCAQCGTRLEPHGRRTRRLRRLRTGGGQELRLQRDYGVCPQCGQGLFPPG